MKPTHMNMLQADGVGMAIYERATACSMKACAQLELVVLLLPSCFSSAALRGAPTTCTHLPGGTAGWP